MSDYYDAFEMSPVPDPSVDAVPPEPFRGIYGMPMFVTIPTPDLAASVDFWVRGFGFVDLFSIPGQVTHLRRWAFQDVLLVPAAGEVASVPVVSVSFACVLSEIDRIAEACEAQRPGCSEGPRHTRWNTVDVEVVTPENVRVVLTAAKPFDPASQEARDLEKVGITAPKA
ncbi:VOC family protein [Streptomyces iconiensis]|uniref:VOC family protein n=1 Tax=Streptomyces iconiensis TaxID=1384038 RepID=A0ABT7A559_9ACTN|nr:VOC family protein [Streptomyces iconiensis]MDJ1136454.1 VOC family protein [Streptomyces iconiensis]